MTAVTTLSVASAVVLMCTPTQHCHVLPVCYPSTVTACQYCNQVGTGDCCYRQCCACFHFHSAVLIFAVTTLFTSVSNHCGLPPHSCAFMPPNRVWSPEYKFCLQSIAFIYFSQGSPISPLRTVINRSPVHPKNYKIQYNLKILKRKFTHYNIAKTSIKEVKISSWPRQKPN